MSPLAIDICAGAGGLSLGLRRAGFDTLGIELDADAVATHRANVGSCELIDVRRFDGTAHKAALIAGGVPCQPFSISGARQGTAREDGRLWLDLLRIADDSCARAILLENVPGFTTWREEDGSLFIARVAQTMERRGWHIAYRILDAADYGVPQHRNRVFIVGFRDASARSAFKWPVPTHGPPGDMFLPPYRTVRQALELGDGLFATGHALDVAGLPDRPSTTVAADPRISRAGREHGARQQNGAVRLTPTMLALLQGFPRDFIFSGKLGSQHRQIGNAIPPAMGEALGRSIIVVLSENQ